MSKNDSTGPVQQEVSGNNNITAAGNVIITQENMGNLPSILADLVPKLNDIIEAGEIPNQPQQIEPYTIENKISHNNLNAYKHWIEDYGQYGAAIDEAYKELDNHRPGARAKVLRSFKARYDRIKGEILSSHAGHVPLDVVRKNADTIIARVADEVKKELLSSGSNSISHEDLDFSSIAMTCHAFINCKILERPIK